MSFSPTQLHTHWLRLAAAIWLLGTSTLAIVNSVVLARQDTKSLIAAQEARLKALSSQTADLDRQMLAARRQPTSLSQTDFARVRKTLEDRLAQVEHSQANAAPVTDIQALATRVDEIAAQQAKAAQATVAKAKPKRTARPAKPAELEPPFRLIGPELRGGERFLAIVPQGTATLADSHLLREGDTEGEWRLQALEAHAAVFRVRGQTQRVSLP